jgi:GTPase SAR1 family protein
LKNAAIRLSDKKKYVDVRFYAPSKKENNDKMLQNRFSKADVVIICFSVSNQDSFKRVRRKWKPIIEKYAPNSVALILVATFSDQTKTANEDCTAKPTFIPRYERYELAQTIGAQFVEVSADEGRGLSNLTDAVKAICLPKKEYENKCNIM